MLLNINEFLIADEKDSLLVCLTFVLDDDYDLFWRHDCALFASQKRGLSGEQAIAR